MPVRSSKVLLGSAAAYTLLTLHLAFGLDVHESASIAYMFIFPVFWVCAGIALWLLFRIAKIELRTVVDHLAMAFSTPVPFLISLYIWLLLA